ncbi:MAG: Rne/Rng family ribonuclease, partial [Cellulomonadaceae bacterium]|nr:Rne/Rng family ribonuclease [Cellulomonadaceae bacterium]
MTSDAPNLFSNPTSVEAANASARPARRRVTRPSGGPAATPAPAVDAGLPAGSAPAGVLSLDDIVLPAGHDTSLEAQAAARQKVTAGRSTGSSRRVVRTVDDIALPASTPDKSSTRATRRASSRPAGTSASAAPVASPTVDASAASSSDVASPSVDATDQQAPSLRLPATALLFQPPVATAPAAGPASDPASVGTTSPASQPDSADSTDQDSHGSDQGKRKRSRGGKGKNKNSRDRRDSTTSDNTEAGEGVTELDATVEKTVVGPSTGLPVAELESSHAHLRMIEARELTDEEIAAAGEVEAIEAELVADGTEPVIPVFDMSDLVEDDADVDIEPLSDDDDDDDRPRRRRRRGGRGRRSNRRDNRDRDDDGHDDSDDDADLTDDDTDSAADSSDNGSASSRRRRRRRGTRSERAESDRQPSSRNRSDEPTALKGSTRLEAKRQRRRDGREQGRRRQIITEAEFLARRESVKRSMVVRERDGRTQIAVVEDGVLVEHYVSVQAQASMVGNVYLGRVQNVLPSMEAAFVDVGKGRNAVLYAGEVNWDAAGIDVSQPRRIEEALKSGDSVLVQVTKDPIGHKGARLTSQVTLAGRYLVLVPGGSMTGISRKLPEVERTRLKKILRQIVPDDSGVIVRTAAEGASEEELTADIARLTAQWEQIQSKAGKTSTTAPSLVWGEPDLAIRVVRDIFNDDFASLIVDGEAAWQEISNYVEELAPDLRERVTRWTGTTDVFTEHRVTEQLAKGMDRKVWLPSGGSLVIDRTEAMTVIDVNTGKFTGVGGTLEETVTRNNIEAAEEIVRQLRLRDIGGIIVIDFIDMVLESNRDLVLRRLVECLGRDRTKHQVAEVTSLGLVQMTRKRVGQGLVEAFSETC